MFLKVDVYANQDATPSQTLHVCLATCGGGGGGGAAPGVLLAVGRKAALTIPDKAVSREHALLTLKATADRASRTDDESDPRRPQPATSDAEVAACRASRDGVCAVWRNLGKLGSYIVQEHPPTSTAKPSNQHDSDSEATDDDDAGPAAALQSQSGMPPPSNATKALVQDVSKVALRAVAAQEDYVLTELSLLQSDDSAGLDSSPRRVIIQVGKGGSTIVLTRRPIHFILGSTDKGDYEFMPQLYQIDAHHERLSDEDGEAAHARVTHHVTPARQVSPSQVASWLRRREIVHPDYLQALLRRTGPTDPLPLEVAPRDDGNAFWRDQPSDALRAGWSAWTLLSYDPRDAGLEGMVRAAGATVVRVYHLGRTVADQARAVRGMLEGGTDKNTCFLLEAKSKKKIVTELHSTLGILAVSTRDVAKFLTSNPRLPDGSEIPAIDPGSDIRAGNSAEDSLEVKSTSRMDQPDSQEVETRGGASKTIPQKTKETKPSRARTPITRRSPRKTKEYETATEGTQRDVSIVTEQTDLAGYNKRAKQYDAPADQEMEMDRSIEKTHDTFPNANADAELSQEEHGAGSSPRKRQRLESTDMDGWLYAAPKGKKRKEFVRTKTEISSETGMDEDELLDVAPTLRVKGLITKALGQPSAAHRAVRTGPNYKAFRKNSVPAPGRARIQLRVHLTKTSEAEQQAAAQLEELEEQRRRADALFAGNAQERFTGRRFR